MEIREISRRIVRVKRHLLVTVLLAACGGKHTPAADDTEPTPTLVDAAPEPVAVVADAAPPPPPPPPEVPAQNKSNDVASLTKELKATKDPQAQLVLHGHLAEALWAQSCKSPVTGLCVKAVARKKKALPTCDGHTDDVVVVPRDAKALKQVLTTIGTIRQLWGDGSALTEITDAQAQVDAYILNTYMAEEVAAAVLMLGDLELEKLLALASPVLDLTPKKEQASLKKFDAWVKAMLDQGGQAQETYQLLLGDPLIAKWAPAGQVAAIARIGDVSAAFAARFAGQDVPKAFVKDATKKATFCDTLAERAQPVLAQAAETYAACATLAAQTDVTDDTAARCAAEAQRLGAAP